MCYTRTFCSVGFQLRILSCILYMDVFSKGNFHNRLCVYLQYVIVGAALMRLAVLSVFEEHFVHVSAGVLEETIGAVEDDESNFTVTQHTQFVGLFHQAKFTLGERHLEKAQMGGSQGFSVLLRARPT